MNDNQKCIKPLPYYCVNQNNLPAFPVKKEYDPCNGSCQAMCETTCETYNQAEAKKEE